jgi:Flp pilus assembly protein TadD
VKKVPQSAAYADSLGWAHYKLGQYTQATEHHERAVSIDPSDPELNDHLGDAYWQTGRVIEARFQWNKAIKAQKDETRRAAIEAKLSAGLPRASAAPARAVN